MVFIISLAAVCLIGATLALRGPLPAARLCLPFALVSPGWAVQYLGAIPLEARTVALGLGILLLLAAGRGRLLMRPNLLDALMLLLIGGGVATLVTNRLLGPSTIMAEVMAWLLPYLYGRLLLASPADVRATAPYAAWPAVGFALLAGLEAVSHQNLLNQLLGRSGSWAGEFNQRFGLAARKGTSNTPSSSA